MNQPQRLRRQVLLQYVLLNCDLCPAQEVSFQTHFIKVTILS